MIIENETYLDFSDVLLKPKRSTLSSRSEVNLIKHFKPKYGQPFSGVPIMAANMATGTFEMANVFAKHQMFVAIAKHNNHKWIDEFDKNPLIIKTAFYTIGMSDLELEGLEKFRDHVRTCSAKSVGEGDFDVPSNNSIKICIDIANGYTQKFADFVKIVRSKFPFNVIIAGNVATPEMTEELIIAGADYVKVGVGSGSVCSTRKITGIGVPQLSAVINCSDAAHGLGGGIIADGGIRTPGDVAKCFGANADFVMIGGMFAGTDECDGELKEKLFKTDELIWIPEHDCTDYKIIAKKYKIFYGMSSEYAQEKHLGGGKDYRASEGVVSEVEYKGSVETVIKELLGGLRSTGTYIGADSIKNFGKCATFIRVNRVHDRNV